VSVAHIPYQIDPKTSRSHYYEELWKDVAFGMLKKEFPDLSGWSHLDFGCGRGESMRRARDLGMDTHGTDTDPECVRLSGAFGTATALDVVTCFHVLEHVPRPKETLRALARIARKRVIVAVPNLSAFHDLIRTHTHWVCNINEGHLQSWDHSHFRNLAERHCGLKILSWGFDTVLIPPFSMLVERIFGSKAALWCETGIFKKLFPFASLSVIALMEPIEDFVPPE
jgi:hypothetical protein